MQFVLLAIIRLQTISVAWKTLIKNMIISLKISKASCQKICAELFSGMAQEDKESVRPNTVIGSTGMVCCARSPFAMAGPTSRMLMSGPLNMFKRHKNKKYCIGGLGPKSQAESKTTS